MSSLGLSGTPEPAEGMWKGLFWPSIHNGYDADLAATRGFWICLILAFVSVTTNSGRISLSIGLSIGSLFDLAIFLFYFLGAVGARQASLIASASMFASYLLGTILYFWLMPTHFSFIRLIGTALLLTNLRAAILIHRWDKNPNVGEDVADRPTRLTATWSDRIADQMPTAVWPWGRIVFYVLAAMLIPLQVIGLVNLLVHHS